MKFTKMHGLGNDYVYINCFEEKIAEEDIPALAIKLSDRHFGIGGDGIILICPSDKADFRMRMYNLDGSEGDMCGNGIRCVGKYVYDRGMTDKTTVTVETKAGIKTLMLNVEDGKAKSIRVDMGEPDLNAATIPVNCDNETFINQPVESLGKTYNMTCVSMGNPHGVIYVDNVDNLELEKIGPALEHHEMFPKRANIEFIQPVSKTLLKMRVWERGSGETLACGTGASASAVASVLNGICERKVQIQLLGGILDLEWNEEDNHVYMTGPASFVFDGETL